MKRELESVIMEQLKKGYYPAYAGEEGYILISMKGYLAAAEFAGAEDPCFWYDDLFYAMIDVESGEDKIECGHFNFMPRKEECKFKVGDIIQDMILDMERYEKILSRIVEYEKVRKQMDVKRNDD